MSIADHKQKQCKFRCRYNRLEGDISITGGAERSGTLGQANTTHAPGGRYLDVHTSLHHKVAPSRRVWCGSLHPRCHFVRHLGLQKYRPPGECLCWRSRCSLFIRSRASDILPLGGVRGGFPFVPLFQNSPINHNFSTAPEGGS